jgi:poly-gamma-glutamate capsule biosynthesis protein CapA/YwtB (metallophosphatase superfamily)
MRRGGLLAITSLAVALAASACSFGGSPGSTVVTSAADSTTSTTSTTSASPASALATAVTGPKPAAVTGPKPAALPRKSAVGASVTFAAVGDMMLGNTPDLPPDPGTYFLAVRPDLENGAQIVFGNLEGTLTTSTASKCGTKRHPGCFAFRNPPAYARYFRQAGFTVLNDANNHSHDFGAAGLTQTVRSIRAAGLAQTGLPGEITRRTAKGIPIAFVAFAPYAYTASLLDLPAARALIRQAARTARIVVVYMHAGAEGAQADHVTGREEIYLGEDRGNPEAFARMAIDAGASLVIASGPHVLRGLQFYRGHLIAYSLGDFASYGDFSTRGILAASMILRVRLSSSGRFEQARLYPVQLAGAGRPVPGGSAISFVARLSAADFGASAARVQPSGVITRAG